MSTQLTLRDDVGNSIAQRAHTPMDLLQLAIEREGSIDVIERLAKLQMEMQDRADRVAFDEALNRCQSNVGRIAPNQSRNDTHSWWADYAQLDRVLRPIYTYEGFSLGYSEVEPIHQGKVRIKGTLSRAGASRDYFCEITPSTTGPKGNQMATATDADAIAMARAKRYILLDIFNIAVGIDKEEKAGIPATKPEEAMDEGVAADFASLIEGSGSLDELKANYEKAQKAARDARDHRAELAFADLKNKMYRKLLKGASHA